MIKKDCEKRRIVQRVSLEEIRFEDIKKGDLITLKDLDKYSFHEEDGMIIQTAMTDVYYIEDNTPTVEFAVPEDYTPYLQTVKNIVIVKESKNILKHSYGVDLVNKLAKFADKILTYLNKG